MTDRALVAIVRLIILLALIFMYSFVAMLINISVTVKRLKLPKYPVSYSLFFNSFEKTSQNLFAHIASSQTSDLG